MIFISRLIISVVFIASLSACKTVSISNTELVKQFNHPELGLVSERSEEYMNAVKTCEERHFSDGVDVEGEVLYDRKKLKRIMYKEVEKFAYSQRKRFEAAKSSKDQLGIGLEYAESAPAYVLDIRRRDNGYTKCMKQDMQLIKTDSKFYDRRDGSELKYDRKLRGYVPIKDM